MRFEHSVCRGSLMTTYIYIYIYIYIIYIIIIILLLLLLLLENIYVIQKIVIPIILLSKAFAQ